MLKSGFISPELGDSVITGLPDRKFFYQELFGAERVFDFSELPILTQPIRPPKTIAEYLNIQSEFFLNLSQFMNFDIINLKNYSAPPTYCTFTANDEMKAIGYEIPPNYFGQEFKQLSQRFKFSTQDEISQVVPSSAEVFIVIHHRYGASLENLRKLIAKFPSEVSKVIFSSNHVDLAKQLHIIQNISFLDNLKCYSTLLKDSRCRLLISEWSGGGQIAQYTLGPQGVVWYYYDHYPDIFNFTMTHKIWELNATLGTYFNCWDFKNVSGCSIRHFRDFESLISWTP